MSSFFSFTGDKQRPKVQTFRRTIGLVAFRRDFLQNLGFYIVEISYDNQDPTNLATIRTDPNAAIVTVPPNSVGRFIDEIHSFVEVTPNAVTGAGELTLSLATPDELRRKGFL